MTRLFDSTVLIAHLRGDVRATDLLLRSVAEGALASVVSRAEVEGGMRAYEGDVAQLFDALDLLPVTDAIARRAGALLRRHRRGHPSVDLADYLIAATAQEHGAELVTLDPERFPMVPALRRPWG